jgi:hypothetical protein
VGLAAIAATHPLVRNNQFLSRMGFPRLWIYLGTTGITLTREKGTRLISWTWQC